MNTLIRDPEERKCLEIAENILYRMHDSLEKALTLTYLTPGLVEKIGMEMADQFVLVTAQGRSFTKANIGDWLTEEMNQTSLFKDRIDDVKIIAYSKSQIIVQYREYLIYKTNQKINNHATTSVNNCVCVIGMHLNNDHTYCASYGLVPKLLCVTETRVWSPTVHDYSFINSQLAKCSRD